MATIGFLELEIWCTKVCICRKTRRHDYDVIGSRDVIGKVNIR